VEHGFYYQHLAPGHYPGWAITKFGNYVQYPEKLREAKEFVEKYGASTYRTT
jgi:hypothetical protein